ncbi:phosphoglycerate dehydrogenase [Bacteriovoracaceae bacterium]|nr:phosphoglycerate dehydrogenase [Bacteriovoracaceae bacterium]
MVHNIQTFNAIDPAGIALLPDDSYHVDPASTDPSAILLRSYKLHGMTFPESLLAVGRAGAGVNNIPVEDLGKLGVPVFNTPGANANAVKELVLAGMLLAARNIPNAYDYVRQLKDEAELDEKVESGKKKFKGQELPMKTLGVIGLGAIGVKVANAALSLGMKVVGFDAFLTLDRAWELSSDVIKADSIEELAAQCDFISVHVPLLDVTRNMLDEKLMKSCKKGATILNFARDGIVNEVDIKALLDSEHLSCYVSDFPNRDLIGHPKCILLPHLGASTGEAETNCAIMVCQQIKEYLELGHIRNSVNFPNCKLSRKKGFRVGIINRNMPNMVGQISTILASEEVNIINMVNKSKKELAYTLLDVNKDPGERTRSKLEEIEGVLKVRFIG